MRSTPAALQASALVVVGDRLDDLVRRLRSSVVDDLRFMMCVAAGVAHGASRPTPMSLASYRDSLVERSGIGTASDVELT
jgi:hypothetical protein